MSVAEILTLAAGAGVKLALAPDGGLDYEAPATCQPEALESFLALARQHKPALLRELAQRGGVRLCENCGKQLAPDAGPHIRCCSGACFGGAGREWQEGRLVHAETGWWQ